VKADGRFFWLFAIGNQAANQIDEEIGGAAMTGMFNLRDILELVNDSLDDRALAQQNLVKNRHELVFHV
jgi:hypothetical protein